MFLISIAPWSCDLPISNKVQTVHSVGLHIVHPLVCPFSSHMYFSKILISIAALSCDLLDSNKVQNFHWLPFYNAHPLACPFSSHTILHKSFKHSNFNSSLAMWPSRRTPQLRLSLAPHVVGGEVSSMLARLEAETKPLGPAVIGNCMDLAHALQSGERYLQLVWAGRRTSDVGSTNYSHWFAAEP
jgi:hypothetical protein